MIAALQLKISNGARKTKGWALIKEVLSSWLPLDRLMLDRIISELPDPIKAQKFRLPYLLQLNSRDNQLSPDLLQAL